MTNEMLENILDETDSRILALLQADARESHAAIGKAVGLTGPSVYARVQRLERDGLIRGYTALLDPAAVGQRVTAFVRVVTGAGEGMAQQAEFEAFVRQEPQIVECYDVDGEDCYVLKIRSATPQTLRALLGQIRALPFVTRTVSAIALQTIKDPGLVAPLAGGAR